MILRRYLIRQVLGTTSVVLLFLVVMLLGGRLIRYFGMAAQGGLQARFLFELIGYNLPYFLELILPLSVFIGLMLVFGRLYADSEMAVLNASGLSRTSLAGYLWGLLLVFFVLEAFITLIAKPWGVRSADQIWQSQSFAHVLDAIEPKTVITSKDYHFYVANVDKQQGVLNEVIIIQTASTLNPAQSPKKDMLIFAKYAKQIPTTDGSVQLDLQSGRRYEMHPTSKSYNEIGFDSYRLTFDIKDDTKYSSKYEGKATLELLKKPDDKAWAELGYRFGLPWVIWLALLMAVLLSKVSPRQGRWLKLVPAVLLYVMVLLLVIALKDPIAKGRIGIWVYPVVLAFLFAAAMGAYYGDYRTGKVGHTACNRGRKAPLSDSTLSDSTL